MRANLVGRSVVSAMTQTPASGPAGPVTTPPMSSPSICTAAPPPCWALGLSAEPTQTMAKRATASPRYAPSFVFMAPLLSSDPTDFDRRGRAATVQLGSPLCAHLVALRNGGGGLAEASLAELFRSITSDGHAHQ